MKKHYLYPTRGLILLLVVSGLASNPSFSQSGKYLIKKDNIVSTDLLRLSGALSGQNQRQAQSSGREFNGLGESTGLIQRYDGKVVIDATAEDGRSDDLLVKLQKLGLKNGVAYSRMVSGLLPISAIDKLHGIRSLKFVRPAYRPSTNIGKVTSQGDTAQYSYLARKFTGIEGLTQKVGILSDSYNNLHGEAKGIGSGDLPGPGNPNGFEKPTLVLLDLPNGGTDEGRAIGEIIHDVAPGASLAFNTAFLGQAGFAQGIIDLANAGCGVIVDDVSYFTEPMFQDGIVAQVADLVSSAGISYCTSAGNYGDQSYESDFRDGGTHELKDFVSGTSIGKYVLHDFDPGPGVDNFQKITIPHGNGSVILSLQWDDPFASVCPTCPGADTDMDLFIALKDHDYNSMFLFPLVDNIGGDPVEVLGVNNSGAPVDAYIVIGKWKDATGHNPNPGKIKYIDFGFGSKPEHDTKSATIFGHSNAARSVTVGAIRYDKTPAYGTDPPVRESFSSVGGTPILFDTKGNAITPVVRKKPNISAPEGTNNTFFGFDYDGDGFPNFFGTSASAPHAAAVAALMREAAGPPNIKTWQITKYMEKNAIDADDPYRDGSDRFFDYGTGYGLLNAPAAITRSLKERMVTNLKLSAVCSEDPQIQRSWDIRNPNDFDVVADWYVAWSNQHGTLVVPANADTLFTTTPVKWGANIGVVKWPGRYGFPNFDVEVSTRAKCPANIAARTDGQAPTAEAVLSKLGDDELFNIYPNPARDELTVSFLLDGSEDFDIQLIDATGKICFDHELTFTDSGIEQHLDLTGLSRGVYVLKAQSPTRDIVKKFIKE